MLESVESRLIPISDAPEKLSVKVLREKVAESEIYKSKITEKVDALFVIINKPEDVFSMRITQNDIPKKNIWFVDVGEKTKLAGKIAETRSYSQKGTAKGRESIKFSNRIMNRLIYVENRRKSYNDKTLYGDIRRSEDYKKVTNSDNAVFYVIEKDQEPTSFSDKLINSQNIWFVVLERKASIRGSVVDVGYLRVVNGKLTGE